MRLLQRVWVALLAGVMGSVMLIMIPAQVITASTDSPSQVVEKANDELPTVTESEYENNLLGGVVPLTVKQFVDIQSWYQKPYILYVGYKECQYCRAESRELNKFLMSSKVPVFYLDLDTALTGASQTDMKGFTNCLLPYQVQYTPTFVGFAKGHAVDYADGYPTTAKDLNNMQQQLLNR